MNLESLDLAIKNNIIMYARPTYPYIPELNNLHDIWYDNDNYFCEIYSNTLILDVISLKKYYKRDYRTRLEYEWRVYNI
jgi:transposase